MKKRLDLDAVDVRVLPPKVIMLLSQFAYYIRRHDGVVIKLASKTVLKDVHAAHLKVNDYILDDLYDQIVDEINAHAHTRPISLFSRIKSIARPTKLAAVDVCPASVSVYN